MRKTLKSVLTEYGTTALVLYLVIFALVLGASYLAISAGWAPESAVGKTGTFAAAYIVTKLTQVFRIAATVALTPLFARMLDRMRGRAKDADSMPETRRSKFPETRGD